MIGTVEVRGLTIGGGRPVICVPVAGGTADEIMDAAGLAAASGAEMAEWRLDWYEGGSLSDDAPEILSGLREILGNMPILATFRTAPEGGRGDLSWEDYRRLAVSIAGTGLADLIDIEVFRAADAGDGAAALIRKVQAAGSLAVASSHEFGQTPPKDEIISRLVRMQEMGADITKIAVMPSDTADVVTLLAASEEMARLHADRPFIAISMGELGMVSRVAGETFGSSVTFASAGRASAPGQLAADDAAHIMDILHAGQ